MMVGSDILVVFSPPKKKSKVIVSAVGNGGRRESVDARVLYLFFLNQLQYVHTWEVKSSASGVREGLALSLLVCFWCCWYMCV